MDWKQEIFSKVVDGDAEGTAAAITQALQSGLEPQDLLNGALIAAMAKVGDLFEQREFYVPEMLVAARAMKAGVAILKPHLPQDAVGSAGTIVMGTVAGDLHDIGKNLVCMMLEGAGFRVIDLGTDVAPAKFIAAIKDYAPQFVGMSALLTTTMPAMKTTIAAIRDAGVRDKAKIIVGGAPITQAYAEEIGADLYAQDANAAARVVRQALQAAGS